MTLASPWRIALSPLLAAAVALGGLVATPDRADAAFNVYITPGEHVIAGRQWRTWCEEYTSMITRCRSEIRSGGTWVFNNLTYLPAQRALWEGNPFAKSGEFRSAGRRWKTSCADEWTGKNACRSFIYSDGRWVFNNIVNFATSVTAEPMRVDTTWRPGTTRTARRWSAAYCGPGLQSELDRCHGFINTAEGTREMWRRDGTWISADQRFDVFMGHNGAGGEILLEMEPGDTFVLDGVSYLVLRRGITTRGSALDPVELAQVPGATAYAQTCADDSGVRRHVVHLRKL